MIALERLLAGHTIVSAAKAAQVDRKTVTRWRQSNASFQAALNRGERDARDALELRLAKLAEGAAAIIERAIQEGDIRASLAVLRGVGLLPGHYREIGSTDARVLECQIRTAESDRKRESALASLIGLG